MIDDHDLGASLRAYLRETPPLPDHVVAGALQGAHGVEQRRRWRVGPVGWPASHGPVTRPTLAAFATAATVLGVAVAGVLAIFQLGGLPGPAEVAAPASAALTAGPTESASPTTSPAQEGRMIVVRQAGGRDARTVAEAVAQAEDGDIILVLAPIDPQYGAYTEAGLTIDKDVTIRGDGDRDSIRIRLAEPSVPQYDDYSHSLWIPDTTDVTIEDVQITSAGDGGADLKIDGSLTLDRARLLGVWVDAQDTTRLVAHDTDIVESGVSVGSAAGAAVVDASHLIDSCIDGSNFVVRQTTAVLTSPASSSRCGGAIVVGGSVIVEGSDFSGGGIVLGGDAVSADASGSIVRDNRIAGAQTAVGVLSAADVTIEGNELLDNEVAVSLVDTEAILAGNTLTGNATGLELGGSGGEIRDNVMSENAVAVSVTGSSQLPVLTHNTLCRNGTNVRIIGTAEVPLDGNDVCPDEAAPVDAAAVVDESGLSWERVPLDFEAGHLLYGGWLTFADGRFAMPDADGVVHVSTDGRTWRRADSDSRWPFSARAAGTWRFGDGWVSSDESATLSLEGADGSTRDHTFRGPISQVAVSPAGIVVVENVPPEAVIEDVLGADVADGDWRLVNEDRVADPERPDWGDQVTWWIDTETGGLVELRLAEHGYGGVARDDLNVATLGWYSPDGVEWTPIRGATLSWDDEVIGTERGFWWRHGNDAVTSLWYSPDGQSWERLTDVTGWEMLPWGDGVVIENGPSLVAATPAGARELAMPSGLLNEDGSLQAGPLGLVWLDRARGIVGYSPDGEVCSLNDMPAEWTDLWPFEPVVGDDAVLVWLHRCEGTESGGFGCLDEPVERQLWRGTLQD